MRFVMLIVAMQICSRRIRNNRRTLRSLSRTIATPIPTLSKTDAAVFSINHVHHYAVRVIMIAWFSLDVMVYLSTRGLWSRLQSRIITWALSPTHFVHWLELELELDGDGKSTRPDDSDDRAPKRRAPDSLRIEAACHRSWLWFGQLHGNHIYCMM